MLTLRQLCLPVRIDRRLKSTDVIDVLSDQFILRGSLGHIRSDNGNTLRYLRAARVAITSEQPFFPTCYGSEFVASGSGMDCCCRHQDGLH